MTKTIKRTKQNKKTVKDLNQMQRKMVKDIKGYHDDPKAVLNLLTFMSRFAKYSFHNFCLIQQQWEGAGAVDSYAGWKKRGFTVKKGEKSQIKIIVPSMVKLFKTPDGKGKSIRKATKREKKLIQSGDISTISKMYFHAGSAFEMSQTNATPDEYPQLYPNRHINYDVDEGAYHKIRDGLQKCLDDLNIDFGLTDDSRIMQSAKGVYYPSTNEILLNRDDTRGERLTVLVHEIGHAYLHKDTQLSRNYQEMQAEAVAYLVSKYFNIDVSQKATKYIADWTSNLKDITPEALNKLLRETQATAGDIIKKIEA